MDSFKPMLVMTLIFLPSCLYFTGFFSGSLMELLQVYLFGTNTGGHLVLFTGFVKFACVWGLGNFFLALMLFT